MEINMQKFTPEDADRLLGLADQYLEEWANDAVESGQPDEDYEQRNGEWETIRPLLVQAPAMLETLDFVRGWFVDNNLDDENHAIFEEISSMISKVKYPNKEAAP
jgi:hypothetical protein